MLKQTGCGAAHVAVWLQPRCAAKSRWVLNATIAAAARERCTDQPIERSRVSLFDAGAAMQVGLDLQPGPAAKSRAINLQILHDPLHVIAGLGERNLFD